MGCIGIVNLAGAGGFTFAAGGSGLSKNIARVLGFGQQIKLRRRLKRLEWWKFNRECFTALSNFYV